MRDLTKILMVTSLALILSSCGKENKSGGGGGDTVAPVTVAPVSPTDWYNAGTSTVLNTENYNRLRSYYEGKSFAWGVGANTHVYHLGSAFGGSPLGYGQSGFDFDLDYNYCIDLFGYKKGNCSQTQYSGYQVDYADIMKKGEYKVLLSADANMIRFNLATSASSQSFGYTENTFDRNDTLYRRMLNLDASPVRATVISKAIVKTVPIDAVGTSNPTVIKADYVEYFFEDGFVEGYIISDDLPMISNPVAVTERSNNSSDRLTGVLGSSGNYKIVSVEHDIHRIDQSPFAATIGFKATKVDERKYFFK